MLLKLKMRTDRVHKYYQDFKQSQNDIGWDLYIPENHIIKPKEFSHKIPHEVSGEMIEWDKRWEQNVGYMLVPRSSMTKYPLVMGNSPGMIDPGYRGDLTGVVHNLSDKPITIEKGTRLFQLVAFSGLPFEVRLVAKLSSSIRGEDGFGSTG